MTRKARTKVFWWALALLLVAALACNKMAERGGAMPKAPPPVPAAQEEKPAADEPGGGTPADKTGAAVERLIVKTAELRLLVESVDPVEPKLRQKVQEFGGFVVTAEKSGTGDSATLSFTFRVPVEKFDAALSAVEAMAKRVDYRKVSGQDVTEEYVDLDAQLRNAQATRDRILEILKRAQSVGDVIAVNQELSNVQEKIERLQGKMKYLKQSAALSTVSLYLYPETKTPVVEEGGWKPMEIVRRSLRALLSFAEFLGGLIIFLAIWTPVWLPLYLLLKWWRKRRRAKRAEKAAAAAAAAKA